MAKQRVVNTYFWSDPFILKLRTEEKLLFLYALTNPQTDLCGAYELAIEKMVFETRLTEKKILEIFTKFEAVGKMCYRDGWVIIKNFGKHQQGASPNVRKGAERSLNACPDWVKQTLSDGIGSVADGGALLLLPIPIPIPIPEPIGKETVAQSAPRKKGTRLSDTFFLTAEMRQWGKERRPGVDLNLETEKFCNYWRATPGQKGTKLNWRLTWNNWILNAKGNSNEPNKQHSPNNQRTSAIDRIADHREILEQYPTEAELRNRS